MNLDAIMLCGGCGHPLCQIDIDGGLGVAFEHPMAPRPHPPIPGIVIEIDNLASEILLCHTCFGPHPAWMYECGDIKIATSDGAVGKEYANRWQVCHRCAQLIDSGDAQALAARSVTGAPADGIAARVRRLLCEGIVESRHDVRTLLTTTRWPAAKVAPDALPKIRSRLAGLLRGPAQLPQPLHTARQVVAEGLDRCQLMWVDDEFTDLVDSVSADLPQAAVTDDLVPAPDGLLVWPRQVGSQHRIGAVSWTALEQGWLVICYRTIGAALDETLMPSLRHEIGWLLPVHVEYVTADTVVDGGHPLAPMLATWLLIDQQLAEVVTPAVPSSRRKAYQRGRSQPPEVKLVRIKARPQAMRQEAARNSSGTRKEPDHRYWVSGHPRNQAYGPGYSLRREIRIKPVLRGPEGAPIRLSTTVRVLGSVQRKRKDQQ